MAASIDADPLLRRIERGAILVCLGAAALALLLTRNWPVPLGVLGGGLLVAISLLAIRSSVDALLALMTPSDTAQPPPAPIDASPIAESPAGLVSPAPPSPRSSSADARRSAAVALVRLVTRYALLAVMAYVMIARLRLHPIGLLIGASSLVASAALEAFRALTRARTF